MTEEEKATFQEFVRPLIGMPVTHVWRGYGSTIFLEFGQLTPQTRSDGNHSPNPKGEWSVGFQWSWRLEGKRRIWCGSCSEEDRWLHFLRKVVGAKADEVELFGRLPELMIKFSNGLHLLSFMTSDGDPQWSFISRHG